MLNEIQKPRINSYKAKDLFQQQYAKYTQFGDHYDLTNSIAPFEMTLYLKEGNMKFTLNHDTEQWNLDTFKVYTNKLN